MGFILGTHHHPLNEVAMRLIWFLLLAVPLCCSAQSATATLIGDPAHPAITSGWLDTKLYFGLGPADVPEKGVSEGGWRAFLDKEVTPRFPAGLSVLDVYGQWLRKRDQTAQDATPIRIRSKMLIIDYPASPENDAKVEAIRVAWKKLTGDQSVLRVTQPATVSF
jgi:hypothetical protein